MIQLTRMDAEGRRMGPVWVNPARIVALDPHGDGAYLVLAEYSHGLTVTESPDEIAAMVFTWHREIQIRGL